MKKILVFLLLSSMAQARTVKIAIIDTGLDTHSYWETMFMHPGKGKSYAYIPKLCKGESKNFVEDRYDYDPTFQFDDKIHDDNGHGTHVTGLIMKHIYDEDYCIRVYKFYDAKGNEFNNLKNSIAAFQDALIHPVDIINYSGGGLFKNDQECAVVKKLLDQGTEIFAAAGNERSELELRHYYPAMCDERVVIVAALSQVQMNAKEPRLLSASNFHRYKHSKGYVFKKDEFDWNKAHYLERPGEDQISILPGGQYGFMSGSSQATANATGEFAESLIRYCKTHAKKLACYRGPVYNPRNNIGH